jgi:hypothetical protein
MRARFRHISEVLHPDTDPIVWSNAYDWEAERTTARILKDYYQTCILVQPSPNSVSNGQIDSTLQAGAIIEMSNL